MGEDRGQEGRREEVRSQGRGGEELQQAGGGYDGGRGCERGVAARARGKGCEYSRLLLLPQEVDSGRRSVGRVG